MALEFRSSVSLQSLALAHPALDQQIAVSDSVTINLPFALLLDNRKFMGI